MFEQKMIYICSPVKGDAENNIAKAREYCKEVLNIGHIPIAPQVAFSGMLNDDIPQEREKALSIGLEFVKQCNELWIFGDRISKGMEGEIKLAKEIGVPVKTVVS